MIKIGLSITSAIAAVLLLIANTALAEEQVRLGLPVPNYGPYVPVYAAAELGLYTKNGIKAEITVYKGGAAAQEALAAGDVDMIVNSPALAALAIKRGVNQKIVGAWTTAPLGWNIMVLQDSPIKSIKDLAGKNVGVTSTGGLTDLYSKYAAQSAGISVNTIPVGASGLIPALKGHQVDASAMHSPLPFGLFESGEGRSIFDIGKALSTSIPDVWVATQEMIKQRPAVVEATLRSVYQATAVLQSDRKLSLKYIQKFTGETGEKTIESENDVILMGMPTSARIDPSWLKTSYDLAKFGGLTDLPTLDSVYTDQFANVNGGK